MYNGVLTLNPQKQSKQADNSVAGVVRDALLSALL
jgi:hypothetical protein